jgi:hypothetical protein
MSETGLKQRLAAILAADAAGYSRLMEADELLSSLHRIEECVQGQHRTRLLAAVTTRGSGCGTMRTTSPWRG